MSPERLLGAAPSAASDVWSLALLFLEVASGRPVSEFLSANGRVSVVNIEQHCPREFRDVLSPCFEEDIKKRCCDLAQLEKSMVGKIFDVFISYRVASESTFALALYDKLVKHTNLRVFLDQSDTGIPLGVEWGPYFFRALSCSTLVHPLSLKYQPVVRIVLIWSTGAAPHFCRRRASTVDEGLQRAVSNYQQGG